MRASRNHHWSPQYTRIPPQATRRDPSLARDTMISMKQDAQPTAQKNHEPVIPTYYAMTMPGIETTAYSEIHERFPDSALVRFARGVVIFTTMAAPAELLTLRTTEDIFFLLTRIHSLGRSVSALRVLHSATEHADVLGALNYWRKLHNMSLAETWRVVSQLEGQHEFRRMDAGQAIIDALRDRMPQRMRFSADEADVEFWLWLQGSQALIGLRLSDATMRHRTYKHEHLPASLRPTIAAAMVRLSQPQPDDIILDPMCGAGTLLIERALAETYDRAIGSDIEDEAVTLARRNARHAGVGISWYVGDARTLKMDADSVTRILTNLPFGKQIGSPQENAELYHVLASEFARVLRPNGIAVTITSDDRLWDITLRNGGWRITKKIVIVVLGQPASIFVAQHD